MTPRKSFLKSVVETIRQNRLTNAPMFMGGGLDGEWRSWVTLFVGFDDAEVKEVKRVFTRAGYETELTPGGKVMVYAP